MRWRACDLDQELWASSAVGIRTSCGLELGDSASGFRVCQLLIRSGLRSPNRFTLRALSRAASSSRFLGGEFVARECRSSVEMLAIALIAAWNASSLAFEGLLKPLIFRTNWSDAARTSSGVTGGSKLKSILMFRHI